MKKIVCVFLTVVFFGVLMSPRSARADGFSVGAALLGGFLIGTIWSPRVVVGPPTVYGPAIQYHYPQQYYPQPRYYAPPPPAYYQPLMYYASPPYYSAPPAIVCAVDVYGNVNCRTIQY